MSSITTANRNVNPGMKVNLWTVLGVPFRAKVNNIKRHYVVARCECGQTRLISVQHLLSGASRNCGCVRRVTMPTSARTHGQSKTPLYRVWKGMRERCSNPNHTGYKDYGGRGISVCSEWDKEFVSFAEWAVSAGWRKGLTIDRIDTNRDYSPINCRIVSMQVNCNNKRHHHLHECWGESKTLWYWSQDPRCVVPHSNLVSRMKQGWTILEAMTLQLNEWRKRWQAG